MNKVILIGRLTRDPELRYTSQGTAVCQITVAVNRHGAQPGQQDADFINVSVWGTQAENVAKYMTKGRQIAVEGRIQTRNYDDKDGKKVYVTEVIATNVQFLDSKSAASDSASNLEKTATESVEPKQNNPFESFENSIEVNENNLPF